ncbi:hypothetical protein DV515_00001833 [Chloebia gouldiae]|uniref:Uncharacterized protein n=1 Tax=Chloebia gouldiae TaxID=44316 RepID=A0A3L8SZ11_CHLGU|nr:hypothetical protein DV515_00001833 [Chloebia gouldiae]
MTEPEMMAQLVIRARSCLNSLSGKGICSLTSLPRFPGERNTQADTLTMTVLITIPNIFK